MLRRLFTARALPSVTSAARTTSLPASGHFVRPFSKKAPTFRGLYFNKTGQATMNVRPWPAKFSASNLNGEPQYTLVRQGRIAIELAPALPQAEGSTTNAGYDWTKKVAFYLTANDVLAFAYQQFQSDFELTRGGRGEDGSRSLSVKPSKSKGYWTLTVNAPAVGNASHMFTHSIDLTSADITMLKHLFTQSLVWITGWMQNLDPSTFDPALHLHTETSSRFPAPGAGAGAGSGELA